MSLAFARTSFLCKVGKVGGLIAAAYLLYLIVVVLVLVPAINGLAPIVFQQQTGRTLQFADITFNPLTLAVTVNRARNDNPDGTPFFSADTLRADLALKSLWSDLTLDEIAVRGLQLTVAQTTAERFNFSDILDYRRQRFGTHPEAAPAAAAPTPITVNSLHVDTGKIEFRAPHQTTPIVIGVDTLTLDIDGLTTRDNPAANATTNAAAPNTHTALPMLALRRAQLAVARADIELPRPSQPFKTHIANVQGRLELFSTRDTEAQPFALALDDESGGHVGASGQVSLATAQSRGDIDIKNLSLLPAWRYLAEQLHFDLDQGSLSLAGNFDANWKDTLRYSAQIRSTQLNAVRMRGRDTADSAVDLGKFALTNLQLDSATRHVKIGSGAIDALQVRGWNRDSQISLLDMFQFDSPADDSPPSAPWSLQLDAFQLDNSRIDWRTDSIDQEQLVIAPLRLNVQKLHWPAAQPANLTAALTVNDTTTLDLKGALIPATQSGSVEGDIKGLPLTWGNRQIARQLTAKIAGGTLRSHFAATLEQGQPLQLTSDGAVDNFQLLRNGVNAPVAAWQQLQWQRLSIDMPRQIVQIERIDFNKPQTRFRINPDGTNNFQEMVIRQPAAGKTGAPKNPATKTTAAKDSETAAAGGNPWRTTVDLIHIQDGTLDFRDNSLPRPFRAVIGNFTGDIAGLGSAPEQVARIDLQGNVDGYAPVTLTGTAAPLRAKPALNLALDFTNLDLATLTSYSGTYAGYAINRGLLTLQLAYKLEDNRLQGQNRIVITRMELGDKVESPKAVDLPLRLALALLTDENGVIDLGVGVEGDLDNPQFSVRGIIWKALRNVIVKAVTSPFRLLAGLVGGSESEDLGVIDFDAGTDHIDAASRERMGKLVLALAKRPSLQLRVIGHADPVADASAMKQGKLDYFLTQDGVDDQDFQDHNSTWRKAVTKLYEKTFPEQKVGDQTPEQLAVALRDSMTLGADAMDFIAARRALAAKRVLVVELGLATDRVLIDAASASKVASNRAQAELKVDL
jgi:hypothetical protein